MRAMVAGGSIGGLVAAIALQRVGVDVVVFERARELRKIGASITLWANAMKALSKLGLREQVRALGWPPPEGGEEALHEVRSPDGKLLYRIPAGGLENTLGEESVIVTRPDLQKTLVEAFRKPGAKCDWALTSWISRKQGTS